MSGKSLIRLALLMVAVLFSAHVFAAEDATMHQVYMAAEAGKFDEAQSMMDKVLRDHPKSAKAHFVEAELMAKQERFSNAQAELNNAERLAPGLPFAKPTSVQKLRDHIAAPHAVVRSAFVPPEIQAPASSEIPWGLLIIVLGLVALIVFAVRFMNRRNAPPYTPNGMTGYGPGPSMPPYGAGGSGPMMGPATGGGMGSGILGGLATGAAMGAGIVAGEALMHHFTDGNRNNVAYQPSSTSDDHSLPNDMGGTDFGIADNSSWDDGSSGGNDDWG